MKLIFCPKCEDVTKLLSEYRSCRCGRSGGKYTDDLNAIINGDAIPLGFSNPSFVEALKNRPKLGMGERFTAFVIAEQCPTIRKVW